MLGTATRPYAMRDEYIEEAYYGKKMRNMRQMLYAGQFGKSFQYKN